MPHVPSPPTWHTVLYLVTCIHHVKVTFSLQTQQNVNIIHSRIYVLLKYTVQLLGKAPLPSSFGPFSSLSLLPSLYVVAENQRLARLLLLLTYAGPCILPEDDLPRTYGIMLALCWLQPGHISAHVMRIYSPGFHADI